MASPQKQQSVAVVVPVLNESGGIASLLDWLSAHGSSLAVTIVDGGSDDDTVAVCEGCGFGVIHSPSGRSRQMNAGALQTEADIYWFVHADCLPPDDAVEKIIAAVARGGIWGRFDVRLSGQQWAYRLIGLMMNRRSCLTGIATGDQGIFVRADVFRKIGGFPDIPLMEDIAISKTLRKIGMPVCLHALFDVSSRRWEKKGVWKTTILMWRLRLQYFLGVSPQRLHATYYGKDNERDGGSEHGKKA